jgi:RimJ/RimL family protein N-acetyltransferase
MIETERLKLIPCDNAHFDTLLEDEKAFADLLGAEMAENWLIFPESVSYAKKMLEKDALALKWGMRVILYKPENKIIGTGGFKGAADENGMVEIGYSIAPKYQNRGLATEAAKGMLDYSFSHDFVKVVEAHTLAEENASGKVLQKCGLTKIGEKFDKEDGHIWHWRIWREEYEDR